MLGVMEMTQKEKKILESVVSSSFFLSQSSFDPNVMDFELGGSKRREKWEEG
jgi:hypothetical protein